MSTEDVGIELQSNTTGEQIPSVLQYKINETRAIAQLQESLADQLKKIQIHSTKCEKTFSVNGEMQILDIDQFGIIKRVRCLSCKKEIPTVCRPDAPVYRVRIESLRDLSPGDHIAWHRPWGYWHHAIFLEGLPSKSEGCCKCCWLTDDGVRVIEYTYNSKDKTIGVIEADENLEGVGVYRFEYNECYLPDYTIELAKGTAGLSNKGETSASIQKGCTQYDPLTDNCEHFARRCKTGYSKSYQVQDCRKACGKNFLMSLLRLVILAIWIACEVLVKDTEEGNENEKKKLHEMELYLSVILSGLFAFLYCLYAICSELSKIRKSDEDRGNSNEPKEGQTNAKTCSNSCCNRLLYCTCLDRCGIGRCLIWYCCCRLLCRMCFECATDRRGSMNPCFLRNCQCSCKAFSISSKIYCNVVIRVIIREIIATGTPIVIFFLYENFWHSQLFGITSSTISGLIGFAISVAVAQISLPIGVLLGSLVEYVFLLLLLHVFCRSNGAQRDSTVPQINEEVVSV